ncbi:head decoration protein [Brevibacillus borstelensis]|uniref:head decoration protein n=1 Tax=Brevibacillus borstelensis TaxID=45462 RepID=UPI00046AF5FA|nr:head decoration protein [Brevibacillus borstelensis]
MSENLVTHHSIAYDSLIAGVVMPIVSDTVVLSAGRVYERGAVLGVVTASGKAVMIDSTKSDGSEKPYAVLAQTVDATEADVTAPIYLTGEFNAAALKFGGTDTADIHKAAMRQLGLFVKNVLS